MKRICTTGLFLILWISTSLVFSKRVDAEDLATSDSPLSITSDVSIELIRRAYLDGRDLDAVVLADRTLNSLPNEGGALRGEIHFWRGSALRRLKRHEEALAALEAAHDLGFKGPEIDLELALTFRALGRQEEATHQFQEAERQAQEDPQKLEDLRKRWKDGADLDKKFQLRVYPQFGYDSNIVGIDKDTLLQQEVSRESFYYGLQLGARFVAYQEKETSLFLDYENNLRGYASEIGLSFTDNLLSATWQSPMGRLGWLAYEVRGSYGEAWVQDVGHFRTLRAVAPALIFRPEENWQIRLWGDYTNADYYEDTPDVQNRDGDMFRGGLSGSIDVGGGWKLAPYLTYWNYSADGDDYDHHAWDIGVAVTTPEFSGIQLRFSVGVTLADYDHPHSMSDFTIARSDQRFSARVTIIFRQLEKVLGFAPSIAIGYEKWSSNIDAFDFNRIELGGSADILAWSF